MNITERKPYRDEYFRIEKIDNHWSAQAANVYSVWVVLRHESDEEFWDFYDELRNQFNALQGYSMYGPKTAFAFPSEADVVAFKLKYGGN